MHYDFIYPIIKHFKMTFNYYQQLRLEGKAWTIYKEWRMAVNHTLNDTFSYIWTIVFVYLIYE